ncbi:aquaporin-like protein [Xylariaceae sp. AK1471]|nr:aquaporin-like protein [Xylariaceae sp. AK1471]
MEPNQADNNVHFQGGQPSSLNNGGSSCAQQRHNKGTRQRGPKILDRIPLTPKSHFVAAISEFVGTFMFLLFAFGGTNAVNTAPNEGQPEDLAANPARLLFISLCFGTSLAVNVWVFYRISGGLFNPAVTIGLMVVGAVGLVRGVIVILSQFLGGIAAAAVVSGLQPGGLYVSTTLAGNTSVVQGLFIEVFLTAQLVFTIMMLAVEKHRSTFMAPIGIGLALFIAQMMGVYYTGGSLNPARSFGPAVVTGSFPTYHWIYFLGPILGALLASGFYKLIKILEYETANPGQDHDGIMDTSAPFAGAETLKSDGDGSPHSHRDTAPGATAGSHGGLISRGSTAVGAYGGGPSMEIGRTE